VTQICCWPPPCRDPHGAGWPWIAGAIPPSCCSSCRHASPAPRTRGRRAASSSLRTQGRSRSSDVRPGRKSNCRRWGSCPERGWGPRQSPADRSKGWLSQCCCCCLAWCRAWCCLNTHRASPA
jgi:hypothetical protein